MTRAVARGGQGEGGQGGRGAECWEENWEIQPQNHKNRENQGKWEEKGKVGSLPGACPCGLVMTVQPFSTQFSFLFLYTKSEDLEQRSYGESALNFHPDLITPLCVIKYQFDNQLSVPIQFCDSWYLLLVI